MTDLSPLGPRRFRRRVLWLLLVACALMALPVFETNPAFDPSQERGQLLDYDDQALLLGEDGALARSPGSFFTRLYYYAYLPFYGLSFWLDGKLGAGPERAWFFRAGNVLWHAAASYLVFLLLGILLRNRIAALIGAVVFAIHPLHVESVAWIAGRKEVLSGCFFFLAWLFHLRAEGGGTGARVWSVLFFAVACFSKGSAVVLPAVLLVAAWLLPRYRGQRGEAARATVPLFTVALVVVVVHLLVGVEKGVVVAPHGLGTRVSGWIAGWGGSAFRTVFPFDLSIDYPEARAGGLAAIAFPGLCLLAALAALVVLVRRRPAAAFGIGAFFVALAPFNNVFPAADLTLVADRYVYLPLFGAAFLVAWLVRERGHAAAVVAGVACVLLAGLSIASASRFVSDEELWTRTIAARDDSELAWISRGIHRTNRARSRVPRDRELLAAGVRDLEAGLARAKLRENRIRANAALVIPLLELGRPQEAAERGSRALELLEGLDSPRARRFKASVLQSRGSVFKLGLHSWRAAARDYLASARLWSRFDAWAEAGHALLQAGEVDAAREALDKAAELDRTRPEPLIDLARMARALDRRDDRKRHLEEARRRAPSHPEVAAAWVEFWLDSKSPDYVRARKELERLPAGSAVRKSLEAQVEAQRALYLFRRRDRDGALAAAERARACGLDRPEQLYELGQIYLDAGRYDRAVECYRGAADPLEARSVHRDAIARAYALKAYQRLVADDPIGAERAFRAALDAQPAVIEAGAAPLRGEIELVRAAKRRELALLAVCAVAGDPVRGGNLAAALLDGLSEGAERRLALRLRALLRCFTPPMDFRGAEADLQAVLTHEPDEVWARYRLAQVWAREGAGWLGTGRRLGSKSRTRQGEELLDRAIEALSRILADHPDFHYARLQRGEARFSRDDLSGAKADYQALRERGAHIKETPLKEAILHRLVYVRDGEVANLSIAAGLLHQALADDPNYFDALFELGNVHHLLYDRQDDPAPDRKRAFNRALFWYRRAMAVNPRQQEPRLEWARLCLKAGREAVAAGNVKSAHEMLVRVESDAPDVVEVQRERVRLCLRPDFGEQTGISPADAFGQARHALEEVGRLAPDDPELPGLRALFHRRLGFSYYWRWAQLQGRKGRERERARARELAVEEWKKAIAAAPDDLDNRALRDRLRELAPEVIVFDEKQAKEAFRKGREAFAAGRFEEAARRFREASQLFPESVDLHYFLALALARSGDLDGARRGLETVANSAESDRFPDAQYELGNIYLVREEPLIARIWYDRYVAAMERLGRGAEPLVSRARQKSRELKDKGSSR